METTRQEKSKWGFRPGLEPNRTEHSVTTQTAGLLPRPVADTRLDLSQSKLRSSQVIPTVQPSNSATNMSPSINCMCNWCHRIQNMSLFPLRCANLCHRAFPTKNVKIYTINKSKLCANKLHHTMLIWLRMYNHRSPGANGPLYGSVTVNITAQFNMSWMWQQLTPYENALQMIFYSTIVMEKSKSWSIHRLPSFLNPSQVCQIGIYPASSCICIQLTWFRYS